MRLVADYRVRVSLLCAGVCAGPDERQVVRSLASPILRAPLRSEGYNPPRCYPFRPSSLARQRRSGPRFPFPVQPHLLRGDERQTTKAEQSPAPPKSVAGCLVIWTHRSPRVGIGQRHTALCRPENHRSASARIALRSQTTLPARYARYPCVTIPFLRRRPNTQIGSPPHGEILKLEPGWRQRHP
jgi:hypothetical protein